jgi:release factor glutamine methyltransferase
LPSFKPNDSRKSWGDFQISEFGIRNFTSGADHAENSKFEIRNPKSEICLLVCLMKVEEAIRLGLEILPRREGIPDPLREARWLLAAAWGVEESALRLHPERQVPAAVEERYHRWLERRAAGEPAHHLTGTCPFWGREFEVGPTVLVPRPETELVVEMALALPLSETARVLDVGTGSGCIAVTLAAERPRWRVSAVDRSPAALAIAGRNRDRHRVSVPLFVGDLTMAVGPPWDLVVANLPYIPSADIDGLAAEVRHDPAAALDGGADGLDLVRRLVADLGRLLRPCGGAVLEVGDGQAEAVVDIAYNAGFGVARRVRDVSGSERVIALQPR